MYSTIFSKMLLIFEFFFNIYSDLLAPESVLTDLYPGDHGKTSPNPANKYELRKLG